MGDRYHRQKVLSGFGEVGQQVLSSSSVLMVGCGGLASPALLYLAGAGVGRIGLMDSDRVDLGNLQRQVLFRTHQAGLLKVDAARESLLALNPEIRIDTYSYSLSSENAESLFSEYDVIVDGTDAYETKAVISAFAKIARKPMIFAGVTELDAQVSVFGGAPDSACYRCLFPAPPKARIKNCNDAGVLGPVVGMAGSLQALETLKVLLAQAGKQDPSWKSLQGRLLILDGRDLSIQVRSIEQNPRCPGCSDERSDSLSPISEISDQELLSRPEAYVLIDVREEAEFQGDGLQGTINLPLSRIEKEQEISVPLDRIPVLFCKTGVRARTAARILLKSHPLPPRVLPSGIDTLKRFL